jgi:hypothetical protein
LKVQDDLGGSLGCNPANLGASRPAVAALMMKGFSLFRVNQAIYFPVADLVDLLA